MVAEAGVREKEKGNERSSTRGPRVDGVLRKREQEGETRDKETNIDNEKTSMAKKEVRRRSEKDEIEKEV